MQPIGMFDSGLGGLTVMRELIQALPFENIVYLGDTARLPYGEKSRETIIRFSEENVSFLASHEVKMVVVACNTASAHALTYLQEHSDLLIMGVIEPSAKKALQVTTKGRIGVLATKGTIRSKAYEHEILKQAPKAHVVPIACPLLTSMVEEGLLDHPATELLLRDYLKPAFAEQVDTLLLGCTHYPLLQPLIEKVVEGRMSIIDSAKSCSEAIKQQLTREGLLNPSKEPATHRFFVTDDAERFRQMGSSFLGCPLKQVEIAQYTRAEEAYQS